MKNQRFYPKQVLKRMKGRSVDTLNPGEQAALRFFLLKGRKYGLGPSVLCDTNAREILKTTHIEAAEPILANSTSKIMMKVG